MSRPAKNIVDVRFRYQLKKDSPDLLIFSYLSNLYGDTYRLEVLQALRNYWFALAMHSVAGESPPKTKQKEIQKYGQIAIYSLYSQIHLIASILEIDSSVILIPPAGFELARQGKSNNSKESTSKAKAPDIPTTVSSSLSPAPEIEEDTDNANWDGSIEGI